MTWLERAQLQWATTLPDLPARYASVTLADIGHERVRAKATEYLRVFPDAAARGLAPVFLGRSGEYKTVAAVALLKAVWQAYHIDVDFVQCDTLLALDIDRFSERTRKLLKRWKTVPLLVLDDFAAPKPDSFAAAVVQDLCTVRFDELWPTIYTANIQLPKGEEYTRLAELYGGPFARRIEEGGRGYTVLID